MNDPDNAHPAPPQYRQGDVLLCARTDATTREPLGRPVPRRRGRLVLAEGEATGHSHTIEEPGAELFEDRDGNRWLKVREHVALRHQEHAPISVGPGIYEVLLQREFDPESWSGVRGVLD